MTASDTPEVPRNPETHTCWQCGYTWKHGHNGSHDCGKLLKADRDRLAGLLGRAVPHIYCTEDCYTRGMDCTCDRDKLDAEIQAALGRGGNS